MNQNQRENVIYNKVDAVRNLNKVNGFDAMNYIRDIKDAGSDMPKWYLDVKYRILWFRLCNPLGKIATEIKKLTDQIAVVEARIYLDYKDEIERYLSKATSQKSQSNVNENISFLEWAETAAIGRALTNAGYGIQFCDMLEANDIQPTESGVDEDKLAVDKLPKQVIPNTPVSGSDIKEPANSNAEPIGNVKSLAVANTSKKENEPTTFEEAMKTLSLKQCKEIKVMFGKNVGKTLGEIAVSDPDDIAWIVNKYRGPNFILRAAATILLDKALAVAG